MKPIRVLCKRRSPSKKSKSVFYEFATAIVVPEQQQEKGKEEVEPPLVEAPAWPLPPTDRSVGKRASTPSDLGA
jgi:hypothetical protein